MSLNATAGDAGAEAFASVAEYDAYLLARGIVNTITTTAKENALRVGASYLVNQYRDRWVGITVTQTQAMPWPRTDGTRDPWHMSYVYPLVDINGFQIDTTTVPLQIKNANIEAALLSLTVSLQPRLERGGAIKSIGKSVGPLRKDVTYADGASVLDRYIAIEGILRGLVKSTPGASSSNVSLVRS